MTDSVVDSPRLRLRGQEFMNLVAERIILGRVAASFKPIASGRAAVVRAFDAIEGQTRRRLDNMQVRAPFAPYNDMAYLDERSRARGVVLSFLTTSEQLRTAPLLLNEYPVIQVGLTPASFLLVDDRTVLAGDPGRFQTLWLTTDRSFVRRAVDLRDEAFHQAAFVADLMEPLSPRQYEIAQALCVGETDASMARRLRISTRSVEREMAVILEHVGARSRTEAVAKIMGTDYFGVPVPRDRGEVGDRGGVH